MVRAGSELVNAVYTCFFHSIDITAVVLMFYFFARQEKRPGYEAGRLVASFPDQSTKYWPGYGGAGGRLVAFFPVQDTGEGQGIKLAYSLFSLLQQHP